MPEKRFHEIYENGKLIKREPYTVGDAELQMEKMDAFLRKLSEKLKDSEAKLTAQDTRLALQAILKRLGY